MASQRTLLAVHAHPDDETITTGGTLARYAAEGVRTVVVTCTRGDGRLISWLVEVWIYPTGPKDWAANVKAEIDLDDSNGDDRCVLKDQQVVTDVLVVEGAVKRATALVVNHPST